MEGTEQLIYKLQQWLNQVEQRIRETPVIQLYVTIAVLLLTSVIFLLICLLKRTKSNTIVLAGLSGSGKTVIFYQLQDGSSHQGTVTSMEPNEGSFVLHSESTKKGKIKPVCVVDVPGQSRLRPKLDEYLPQAAGLVFVVDALDFLPNSRAAAEDKLRTSRSVISAADIANEFTLGVTGESFAFSQCHNKVTVAECSGLAGEISQVEQFIRENVKP